MVLNEHHLKLSWPPHACACYVHSAHMSMRTPTHKLGTVVSWVCAMVVSGELQSSLSVGYS